MIKRCCLVLTLVGCANAQQSSPELREILDRLGRLEEQNRDLMQEVRSLREQLGADSIARASSPREEVPTVASRLPIE